MTRALLTSLLAVLAGCNLYFGDHHQVNDDIECGGDEAITTTRDPSTGLCQFDTPTCSGGCDCTGEDLGAPPIAQGPSCDGACELLDESTCLATSGCHAEYLDKSDGTNSFIGFNGCWDIEPMTVLEGDGCTGLDPLFCAMHDDCTSLIKEDSDGSLFFADCQDEVPTSGTCAGVDCGPGWTCAEQCDDSGSCYPICEQTTPMDPGSCDGEIWCDVASVPACPDGTTAGIENGCYTGFCIPLADCGPNDPGTCGGATTCASDPPLCPAGTEAGVKDGCWSGYCIPEASCPQPACEQLTDEASCLAGVDCEPIYVGTDCTCTPDGACTCASQKFDSCVSFLF